MLLGTKFEQFSMEYPTLSKIHNLHLHIQMRITENYVINLTIYVPFIALINAVDTKFSNFGTQYRKTYEHIRDLTKVEIINKTQNTGKGCKSD